MSDSKKLLRVSDIAQMAEILPGDFRSRVQRGKAPKPDDPGDLSLPPQRRSPGWHQDTIDPWLARLRQARIRRAESEGRKSAAQEPTPTGEENLGSSHLTADSDSA